MRKRCIAVLSLVGFVGIVACGGPGQIRRDPYYASPGVPPRSASAEARLLDEVDAEGQLAEADLVFVGVIDEVGRSPGVGSGIAVVTQRVAYRVERAAKGAAPADRVVVEHVLAGGATADPSSTHRLNPAVFREGRRVLVWARVEPVPGEAGATRLVCPWETPGPVDAAGHAATRLLASLPPR